MHTHRLIPLCILAACAPAPEGRSPSAAEVPDGTEPAPPIAVISVEGADLWDAHPLMKDVHVALSREGSVRLTCTSPDELLENIVLTSREAAVNPVLRVFGLLAETTYDCTAVATAADGSIAEGQVSFATGALPADLPVTWVLDDTGENQGYALYNTRSPSAFVIVDREGRPRWYDLDAEGTDADIGIELAWQPDLEAVLSCGGEAIAPTLGSLGGEKTLRAPEPLSPELGYHHDCSRTEDDEILALEKVDVIYQGEGLYGAAINLYAPDGSVRWQWTTQQGIDQGRLGATNYGAGINMDPWHANSVAWLDDAEGPAAFLSHFGQQHLLRIDRETGDITWNLGKATEEFTLVGVDGEPLDASAWFSGTHGSDFEVRPDGLHVVLYDNGATASRVMELRIDPVLRIVTQLWVFEEPDWYTPIWGDADHLPDGKVLVAKGHCFNCGGVPEEGRSEILVYDPIAREVAWRLQFEAATAAIYRAQLVEGCDIFANARYCPELAAR